MHHFEIVGPLGLDPAVVEVVKVVEVLSLRSPLIEVVAHPGLPC